jgi:hypothetical protein
MDCPTVESQVLSLARHVWRDARIFGIVTIGFTSIFCHPSLCELAIYACNPRRIVWLTKERKKELVRLWVVGIIIGKHNLATPT